MTSTELKEAAKLLRNAADEYSNHGCNDYWMDNTDENWELAEALYKNRDAGDRPERPARSEKICVHDWLLMHHLAAKLERDRT